MCNCNCCKQRRLGVSRDELNRHFPTKLQLSEPGRASVAWDNITDTPVGLTTEIDGGNAPPDPVDTLDGGEAT